MDSSRPLEIFVDPEFEGKENNIQGRANGRRDIGALSEITNRSDKSNVQADHFSEKRQKNVSHSCYLDVQTDSSRVETGCTVVSRSPEVRSHVEEDCPELISSSSSNVHSQNMEIDSPSAVSEEYDEMSDPCVHDGSIPAVDTTPDAGSMEADWIDEERRDDEELQINIAGLTMETDEDLNDEVDLIAPIVWSDQSISAEYILEILHNMKAREAKLLGNRYYMQSQNDITPKMRGILIDWLIEVVEDFALCPETLNLTANYLDRYLSCVATSRARLQLVGITCLLLASKYEEISPPSIDDLVYMTEHTYTREQVIQLERVMLTFLNFSLTVVTPWQFIPYFLDAAFHGINASRETRETVRFLCQYFIELSLVEYEFIKWLPSMVAAACVTLALDIAGLPSWSRYMEAVIGYSCEDISLCMQDVLFIFRRAENSRLRASFEKFSQPAFLQVALLPVPQDIPEAFRSDSVLPE